MTAKEIAELFEELELHLIASLKRNLMRHKQQEEREGGSGGVPEKWEAWQAAKLRDIQRFRRENKDILGEYKSVIDAETEKLLQEQYAEGGSEGFFRTSDERLRSLIQEMQGNTVKVENAALRYMNDVYRKTIMRTATAMTAGGMTLQKATDEATKDFLAQGINCVEYSNGRRVNIATYAEMALRACATRAMLMGEAKRRERMGIDTVLVSQYGACSDTCMPWQGKVYIDDVFQDYHGPTGGSFGVSRNGRQYLFLSVAIDAGLFHPNCRHTISTWIEGISRKPRAMDIAKIERVNKLEAQQRSLELAVRKARREVEGLTEPVAVEEAKQRLEERQNDLQNFLKEHSDVLRRDQWRERYDNVPQNNDGFTKTMENAVENKRNNAIMGDNEGVSEEIKVHRVTRLDVGKYKCVTEDIATQDVVITDERIQHIMDRHPNDFERYEKYMAQIIENPDYILQSEMPNTAFILKEIQEAEERFQLILRIKVSTDPENYKNSIITFLKISEKKWNKYLRNKKILYKHE